MPAEPRMVEPAPVLSARRLLSCAALLCALALTLSGLLRIDTDVATIFGEQAAPLDALDSPAGRQGIVLITAGDRDAELSADQQVREILSAHPRIASVSSGPQANDADVLNWLWQHRFRLAPPAPADLETSRLATRLKQAVADLTSGRGMVLGDRMLRDPTGSFRTLIDRIERLQPDLSVENGRWEIDIETEPGREYCLERAEDLAGPWKEIIRFHEDAKMTYAIILSRFD